MIQSNTIHIQVQFSLLFPFKNLQLCTNHSIIIIILIIILILLLGCVPDDDDEDDDDEGSIIPAHKFSHRHLTAPFVPH